MLVSSRGCYRKKNIRKSVSQNARDCGGNQRKVYKLELFREDRKLRDAVGFFRNQSIPRIPPFLAHAADKEKLERKRGELREGAWEATCVSYFSKFRN